MLYLQAKSFAVVTDPLFLKYLVVLKDTSEKVARSVLEIQNYDFVTEHRGGPS